MAELGFMALTAVFAAVAVGGEYLIYKDLMARKRTEALGMLFVMIVAVALFWLMNGGTLSI